MRPPPEGALSYRLRAALLSDAAEIARLSSELGYPASTEEMSERLRSLLSLAHECVLVADAGEGHLLGWISASRRLMLEYPVRVEIVGLIVDRTARRLGLGHALTAAVAEWAVEQGTKVISVHSNVVRPDSHPFYESLGYRREKTQHYYLKSLARMDGSPA